MGRKKTTKPVEVNKIVWSGKTSSYHHKWHNTPNPSDTNEGFRKVWLLDAQWSTCPIEVEDQVKDLWMLREFGNDTYMLKTSVDDLVDMQANDCDVEKWDKGAGKWGKIKFKTDAIVQWIKEQEPTIKDDELIIIHWWW